MRFSPLVTLFFVILAGSVLSGCAPRPASDESLATDETATDKAPTEDSQPESVQIPEPGPRETLVSSAAIEEKKKDVLPFSYPAKMTESDIERILSEKPPEEATIINLRFVAIALLLFEVIYDRYPTEEEGLAILLDPPVTPQGKKRNPIAREILLKDGWGNPIQYKLETWEDDLPGFAVWSLGPDGVESEDDVRPDLMDEIVRTAAMIEAGALEDISPATAEAGAQK